MLLVVRASPKLKRATIPGNLRSNFQLLFERLLSSGRSKTCRRGAGLDARAVATSIATAAVGLLAALDASTTLTRSRKAGRMRRRPSCASPTVTQPRHFLHAEAIARRGPGYARSYHSCVAHMEGRLSRGMGRSPLCGWWVASRLWLRFAERSGRSRVFATFGHAHIRGLAQDLCSSHLRCLKSSAPARRRVLRRRNAEVREPGSVRTASPTAAGCQMSVSVRVSVSVSW